jgi:hypothetical protein
LIVTQFVTHAQTVQQAHGIGLHAEILAVSAILGRS